MRREPLLGGGGQALAASRAPPDPAAGCRHAAPGPGRRGAGAVVQAVHGWWRRTTDRNYLASPASRRVFWRLFPYLTFSILVLWLVLMWTSLVHRDNMAWRVLQGLVVNMLTSLLARSTPTTSVCPDFLFSTAWGFNLWVAGRQMPTNAPMGFMQIGFFLFYAWAAGIHSFFVAYFWLIGCLAISTDPRFDISTQVQLILLGFCVVTVVFVLEWQSVSHFQKLQKLLNVSTDGRVVVNRTTGTIVSMSEEASQVLGSQLIGKLFGCLAHDTDRTQVEQCFSQSLGEPSEAFMATLWCRQRPEAKPTQEFEARIIPYEIAGPHLHFCLQVVGEVRAYDFGAGSAEQTPANTGAFTTTHALDSCRSCFALERSRDRETCSRDDDACSFAVSSSTGGLRIHAQGGFGGLSEQDDGACALTVSSLSEALLPAAGRRPAAQCRAEAGVQTGPPLAEDIGLPSLEEAIAEALPRRGGRAASPWRSAAAHGRAPRQEEEEVVLAVETLRRTGCNERWAARGGPRHPPLAAAEPGASPRVRGAGAPRAGEGGGGGGAGAPPGLDPPPAPSGAAACPGAAREVPAAAPAGPPSGADPVRRLLSL